MRVLYAGSRLIRRPRAGRAECPPAAIGASAVRVDLPAPHLRALQSSHKRKAVERETYMSKEQLQGLRRVQAERIEVRIFLVRIDGMWKR